MSKITSETNKGLFAGYIGLTAAGYDLANKNDEDIVGLYRRIRKMDLPHDVIDYFARARTNQNNRNPYWPRGYLISSACFFISVKKSARYETFDDFLQFVHSLNNIDQQEINDTVIDWLKQLPLLIDVIIGNDAFSELWETYRRIVDVRSKNYTKTLQLAEKSIDEFSAGSELKYPDIVFSTNLLQSPYLADIVTKENQLIIIKTAPDVLSIVHEYLHFVMKPMRTCFKEHIQKNDFTKIADTGKLFSSGYMWNESDESRINVLEESFVRGLSIAMCAKSSEIEQVNNSMHRDVNSGFILVPKITQTARNSMPNSSNLRDFITAIMDSGLRRNGKK